MKIDMDILRYMKQFLENKANEYEGKLASVKSDLNRVETTILQVENCGLDEFPVDLINWASAIIREGRHKEATLFE